MSPPAPAARLLHRSITHSPSSNPDTYIYSLLPVLANECLAVLTSDDELLVLNKTTLRTLESISGVPVGATCLVNPDGEGEGKLVACSGRDGVVSIWDLRAGGREKTASFEIDRKRPITALTCRRDALELAAGTELDGQQAVITLWDVRTQKVRWQAVESHNDDITSLQFHPIQPTRLLSGSTDGLISIFDTTIQEEEDSLVQVINHGSVHKAGFLAEDAVYALSHDEQFSIHPVNTADEEAVEPSPIVFGDVREKLGCDYVADVMVSSQGPLMATGTHTGEPKVDLIPIGGTQAWALQDYRKVQLVGGHGEDIVRAVHVDDATQAIFTGGEDGNIKVWTSSP